MYDRLVQLTEFEESDVDTHTIKSQRKAGKIEDTKMFSHDLIYHSFLLTGHFFKLLSHMCSDVP